ncbi:hypothetical protein GGX14DRAFT_587431 [Mycena pura]|uniref:F-box domain-containing protein n=1 Tax=Mycena pura TaxID=153505 RepID=A0AAD6USR8_9AGAR|nr:hypothetical protein GGX14DRAFT_587431 [Mycena pura]
MTQILQLAPCARLAPQAKGLNIPRTPFDLNTPDPRTPSLRVSRWTGSPRDRDALGRNHNNAISNVIKVAEVEVSAIDAEIARLQRTIDQLTLQRTEFKAFIQSHRSVVSTIRTLPSDILYTIFSHLLPVDLYNSSYEFKLVHPPLSHVMGVCNRWRTIALTSPLLWSHICLRIGPLSQDSSIILRYATLMLQRSAPAPLSLRLCLYTEPTHISTFKILNTLLAERTRWQDVSLNIGPHHLEHLTSSGAEFPNLRKLTLHFPEPCPEDRAHQYFKPFSALVDLELWMNRNPIPKPLEYLWTPLRTCTLGQCLLEDILRILPLFSPDARIYITYSHRPEMHTRLASVRSAISALSFSYCDEGLMDDVLTALTAPRLQELVVWGYRNISTISALLRRSSCALTHIGMCLPAFPEAVDEMVTLLESPHALHIQELDLVPARVLLPQLIDALATRNLVPNLRVLVLKRYQPQDDTALFAMLQSRRPTLRISLVRVPPIFVARDFNEDDNL